MITEHIVIICYDNGLKQDKKYQIKENKKFIEAAEKNPDVRTSAYYYSGICYKNTGRTEKAVEKLAQKNLFSPEILEKYKQLQELFQEIGRIM